MERWKTVKKHPGYQVSTYGRVRSRNRQGIDGRYFKGRVLKIFGKRYKRVGLSNGKVTEKLVHRLVLETFVGPCPRGMEGCHNNGNRSDCRLSNLRWDTRAANAADMVRHGTCRLSKQNRDW